MTDANVDKPRKPKFKVIRKKPGTKVVSKQNVAVEEKVGRPYVTSENCDTWLFYGKDNNPSLRFHYDPFSADMKTLDTMLSNDDVYLLDTNSMMINSEKSLRVDPQVLGALENHPGTYISGAAASEAASLARGNQEKQRNGSTDFENCLERLVSGYDKKVVDSYDTRFGSSGKSSDELSAFLHQPDKDRPRNILDIIEYKIPNPYTASDEEIETLYEGAWAEHNEVENMSLPDLKEKARYSAAFKYFMACALDASRNMVNEEKDKHENIRFDCHTVAYAMTLALRAIDTNDIGEKPSINLVSDDVDIHGMVKQMRKDIPKGAGIKEMSDVYRAPEVLEKLNLKGKLSYCNKIRSCAYDQLIPLQNSYK